MKEERKDIKWYEWYYQISNYGKARSIDRFVVRSGNKHFLKWKPLALALIKKINSKNMYYEARLCKNGKRVYYKAHRLVAESFLQFDRTDTTKVIMHLDDNWLNNVVSNLKVGTQLENVQDMIQKRRNNGCPSTRFEEYNNTVKLLRKKYKQWKIIIVD